LKFLPLIFFVLTNIGTHAIANGGGEKILVKKSLNQKIAYEREKLLELHENIDRKETKIAKLKGLINQI
jgi:cell division protein FtsB